MLDRAVRYYGLINRPGIPEESKGFRVAVLLTVLISVTAALFSGAVGLGVGIPVLLGIITGSYFSYRRRARANLLLKFILTVLLLVAFALFWKEFSGSISDLRYPLVRLFLWLQVLHSFDLPTRRDLDFSLVSATILMAFAGSLSLSTDFLFLLVPFFAFGIIALYLEKRSTVASGSDVFSKGRGGSTGRALLLTALAVVPVMLALFILLPRLPGFYGSFLPVSRDVSQQSSFEGLIRNPGYKEFPDRFPAKPPRPDPNSYFGFSKFLDLRMRGVPSRQLVMKVRSSWPAYWRSTAFDRYLGNGWENTEKKHQEVANSGQPITIEYKKEPPRYATRELVQTFFIERDLPNTVFAAYLPREAFFPAHVLKVDSMMTVIAPIELNKGTVYTVVSDVSDATPDMLRGITGPYPGGLVKRYTELPPMSPEVGELARRVTAGKTNDYDRVTALSEYLKANYPYDLNCGRQGDGEDSVEFFLFKEKRGFCEHFATALAVMCRSIGIPARLAVGFSTGDPNPLTGYYEVTARDAHAWVEVYFPFFGWAQFDPTPGWSDPGPYTGRENTWSGVSLIRYIGKGLSRIFPPGFRRAIRGLWSTLSAAFTAVAAHWKGVLLLLGLLACAAAVTFALRRRKRSHAPRAGPVGPRQAAVLAIERMYGLLARAGLRRRPSQTPREFAGEVERNPGLGPVMEATDIFNRVRYGAEEPGEKELEELERLVSEVEGALEEEGKRCRGSSLRHV